MPVSEQDRVSPHIGNGSTTNFAYTFRIFADEDLQVVVDDVLQTLTTDYTVNGANDPGGGSIDFITAPINLSAVTISGELSYDREQDYIQNGDMRADNFDNDFDYQIMLDQQLRRDIKRAIKVPIEETGDQEISFTPAERANKVSAFDASGNPTVSTVTDLSSILTTVDTSLVLSGGVLSVAIPNRLAVAGGTVDAITAVFDPVIAALANNIAAIVEASGANASTTPTFAPDGLPPKTMVKENDIALVAGDIPGANYRMHLVFDATLDKWVLLNPVNPSALLMANPIDLIDGSATIPALRWNANDGFYFEEADDSIRVVFLGAAKWLFKTSSFESTSGSGLHIGQGTPTSTAPNIRPNKNDLNTGIGWAGADQLSLIAGGVESARVVASGITVPVAAASPPVANTLSKENIVKGWIRMDGTGAISIYDSFNVDSIVDNGVGDFTITWDTDFANVNYCATTAIGESPAGPRCHTGAFAIGSLGIFIDNDASGRVDADNISLIAMGDQ